MGSKTIRVYDNKDYREFQCYGKRCDICKLRYACFTMAVGDRIEFKVKDFESAVDVQDIDALIICHILIDDFKDVKIIKRDSQKAIQATDVGNKTPWSDK